MVGYVGRGGAKLKHAIDELALDLTGAVGADFGCNIGGFTDCMLQAGAVRVYAVDTGYGMLAWKLRTDERVIVMERTNAMHVELPEAVDLVAVDVGWTRQRHILPNALRQVQVQGVVLSLFKPQYEAERGQVRRGRIKSEDFEAILEAAIAELKELGIVVGRAILLPQEDRRKNPEAVLVIHPAQCGHDRRDTLTPATR
jgi:23S rRNA (cytidine1920-2'-O)/16S rRNA (cytidine1409-2'-O)-methyltransferase